MVVLSHITVRPLRSARTARKSRALASLDLGRTESEVELTDSGVVFPDGQRLGWDVIEQIAGIETTCFYIHEETAHRIQVFSPEFQRLYSLFPTESAPTMMAAGFPMHRIKGMDPLRDTHLKVKTISPVFGEALDTCTGLGYSAIEMAKTAARVTTIEVDRTVYEICRHNPWSQELFSNPRIARLNGDALTLAAAMPEGYFTRILHDPPTLQLAGELYSAEMYRVLYRVLKRGGQLFHYIGDLNSPFGRSVARGAVRRLQEAGFQVTRRPEAYGLQARKWGPKELGSVDGQRGP